MDSSRSLEESSSDVEELESYDNLSSTLTITKSSHGPNRKQHESTNTGYGCLLFAIYFSRRVNE